MQHFNRNKLKSFNDKWVLINGNHVYLRHTGILKVVKNIGKLSYQCFLNTQSSIDVYFFCNT
jgi:hypothetical protein